MLQTYIKLNATQVSTQSFIIDTEAEVTANILASNLVITSIPADGNYIYPNMSHST